MKSFVKRYQQGERLAVWAELVSLGATVRDEPLYSDARAVALEMMTRAKHNVTLLVERLQQLKYRFAYPDKVWVTPNSELLADIDKIEKRYGPFPIALRMWYEVVGVVNFMGTYPKLNHTEGFCLGGSNLQGHYPDPIMVECDDPAGLVPYFILQADSNIELTKMRTEVFPPYAFSIGLSAIELIQTFRKRDSAA